MSTQEETLLTEVEMTTDVSENYKIIGFHAAAIISKKLSEGYEFILDNDSITTNTFIIMVETFVETYKDKLLEDTTMDTQSKYILMCKQVGYFVAKFYADEYKFDYKQATSFLNIDKIQFTTQEV
jgi:hypothetical protein